MKVGSPQARAGRHLVLSLAVVAAACSEPSTPPAAPKPAPSAQGWAAQDNNAADIAGVGDQLAQVRALIAPFHDTLTAKNAGYSTQLTGCMTDPTLGGMGFHYAKVEAIDGKVDQLEPEALLYEPQSNGGLELVAVEYIVPYAIAPRDGPAPTAFGGQKFLQFDDFQVWGLHAWVDKGNPRGVFAPWNPNVNCDAVPAAARMSHAAH